MKNLLKPSAKIVLIVLQLAAAVDTGIHKKLSFREPQP